MDLFEISLIPKIYSVNLREKVMKHYHDTHHKSQTCHFLEILKRVDPSDIYYMDEAGMSCNEVAQMGWSKKGTRCHATRSGLSSRPMSFIGTISLAEKLNLSCVYYLKAVVIVVYLKVG